MYTREKIDGYYTPEIAVCPVCGENDFAATAYCYNCHSECLPEELINGVCNDCISEFKDISKSNIDICFELGKKSKVDACINSFIFDYFGDEEAIEQHLLEYIKGIQQFYKQDFAKFIDEVDDYDIANSIKGQGGDKA